ncbi:MAG: sugar ABC transporter permease [Clostridia bacterium]|nr:sugar ABC transporter permease [Clostridia bacterium]
MISKKVLAKKVKESIPGWLFILPTVAGLCIFTLAPIIQSVMYSFHDYDMTTKYDFVGLGNYIKMFRDPAVRTAFRNTLIFGAGNIAMVLVLTYALALLLNLKIPGIKIFRVVYYLPCVIPAIAGGILWSNIMKYGTESPGIFNQIRMFFGLSPSSYFFSSDLEAIRSILVMNLWSLGGGTIIWLAAFKNIPEQLYEAAEIDGAGRMRKLVSITIPQSGPLFLYNMITLTIATVQFNGTIAFAPNTGAGNNDATLMLGVKVYIEAFRRTNIGYASALSWVLMIITAAITLIMFKVDKRLNDGNY